MASKILIFLYSFILVFLFSYPVSAQTTRTPPYPYGNYSVTISGNKQTAASGSDNWPITWAVGDKQYSSWGDGGGFGSGYYDIGVAEITGRKAGTNLWFNNVYGKSYGILGVNGILWMWQCGEGSDAGAFKYQRLLRTTGTGALGSNWTAANVTFDSSNNGNFFCPTFLQFGMDYSGARDSYVYTYAPINKSGSWNVQTPGEIVLFKIDKSKLTSSSSPQVSDFQFFTGLSGGLPSWGTAANKKPVFSDSANGVMRTSVSYNSSLKRYFLITQQVTRSAPGGYIGIYDAPEPWGPWTTVLFKNAWDSSLNGLMNPDAIKTVFFNFSNKWASGNNFVMVYTDRDNWASIEGYFNTGPVIATPTKTPTPIKSPTKTPTPIKSPTKTPTPIKSPTKTPTPGTSKPGDANGDNLVNGLDYLIWLSHYGEFVSGPANGDFNNSGKVDGADYLIWLSNYGK
ncbi:hypothetical protein A2972_04070 [Candidatus Amesbacteria bacterium RIFCSPLOWO2_01_FULL_47_33]|uniref:Dockerin domain-containing protein n=1 Tax=Candidatus Amesbacteria bacterium RIFCSPLOWO2_01_FULL_47_33 TaxID=1797258 RepID=A0A1F4Z3Y2_9BACT|nr:MAG: hypothetical protein A2972_04070 [Candidatus Amesbacteria bacterium RIFCSPLOWO2_01_FULL_47_33]